MRKVIATALVAGCFAVASSNVHACEFHTLLGLEEPTGVWLTSPLSNLTPSSDTLQRVRASRAPATSDPALIGWKLPTTGAKGHSTDATINGLVSNIYTDVDRVAYDSSYAYIHSSDVPSHNVG